VIGEAGLVFEEGNAEALLERLKSIIDDPRLAESLASLGRERVLEHYTDKIIAAKTIDAYRKVLDA
jgi:glycosyltransferase involved in cell wall biosynthesis